MTSQVDLEAEIQRMLTEDEQIAEQGITVNLRDNRVVLGGEVETPQRRDEICRKIAERVPGAGITCDIGITRAQAPAEVEEIS